MNTWMSFHHLFQVSTFLAKQRLLQFHRSLTPFPQCSCDGKANIKGCKQKLSATVMKGCDFAFSYLNESASRHEKRSKARRMRKKPYRVFCNILAHTPSWMNRNLTVRYIVIQYITLLIRLLTASSKTNFSLYLLSYGMHSVSKISSGIYWQKFKFNIL